MVDFNNEATIGRPAIDIVRVLILQARYDTLEALKEHTLQKAHSSEHTLPKLKANVLRWWMEIEASFLRRYKEKRYKEVQEMIETIEEDEIIIMKAIHLLNKECDDIRLTMIDTKPNYDRTDIEAENTLYGY